MEANTYSKIYDYSEIMIKKNLSWLPRNISEPSDFATEAFIRYTNFEDAVKYVRSEVINEKRRLLAVMQENSKKNCSGEKKCSRCKTQKDYSLFYPRVDSKTGFKYFESVCKECLSIQWQTPEFRERKKRYATSERGRSKNRERQKRFQERKKQLQCKK